MHGVGILKMMFDMNEDLSALKRQRRDAITSRSTRCSKPRRASSLDIQLRPGGVWQVPDTEE